MFGPSGVGAESVVVVDDEVQPTSATDVHSARTADFTRSRYRGNENDSHFRMWLSEEGVQLLGEGLHRDFATHALGHLAIGVDEDEVGIPLQAVCLAGFE